RAHRVPFQCSRKAPELDCPAAHASPRDSTSTDDRKLIRPAGLGDATAFHPEVERRTASVRNPPPALRSPTAHSGDLGAASAANRMPPRDGAAPTLQRPLASRSTRGRELLWRVRARQPTAHTSPGPFPAMPRRE